MSSDAWGFIVFPGFRRKVLMSGASYALWGRRELSSGMVLRQVGDCSSGFFCSLDCICLKIYLHVYMCKCIYIIYVYLCVHMCIIYLCVHLCMCMYMCICICMCASACGHCVHVCVKANLRCCFSSPVCHILLRQCLSPTKNLPNRRG